MRSPDGFSQAGPVWDGTTILGVRLGEQVALAGDGQVSMGSVIVKSQARKLRRLRGGQAVAGFAGATADALTLFERLETKLEQYPAQLARACIELARDWRSDRILRRLEAMMVVGDRTSLLLVSGTGDVLEPDDGLAAIGSGGHFALAAARAFVQAGNPDHDASWIAEHALRIAAGICVYTNDRITVETF